MKITAPWLNGRHVQALCAALEDAGQRALFVGGCVRNELLGTPVSDLDMATDARPETVTDIAESCGFRVIPTGIDHGTVTVIAGKEPVEVTTFRRDVTTDGRRATVAFAEDVAEDARRRDFTINALYCDARGALVDPLGGLPDLRARRLRFIGDPAARIAEDYLRILRFFRFSAWYADPAHGIDAEGLAACAAAAEGLSAVSAERLTAELLKLLAAPDPAPAVAAMEQAGILFRLLPGADSATLARFLHWCPEPDPIARLAALGGARDGLRLSRADASRAEKLLEAAASLAPPAELGYRHGAADGRAAAMLRAALTETIPPQNAAVEATRGAAQCFPLSASDLMPALSGPALGAKLRELEARWIASDFTLTRQQLLA